MLSLSGTIKKVAIATGTWALQTSSGETYEILRGAPAELLQDGQRVSVTGTVRADAVSVAMIGPILEVSSFEVID